MTSCLRRHFFLGIVFFACGLAGIASPYSSPEVTLTVLGLVASAMGVNAFLVPGADPQRLSVSRF